MQNTLGSIRQWATQTLSLYKESTTFLGAPGVKTFWVWISDVCVRDSWGSCAMSTSGIGLMPTVCLAKSIFPLVIAAILTSSASWWKICLASWGSATSLSHGRSLSEESQSRTSCFWPRAALISAGWRNSEGPLTKIKGKLWRTPLKTTLRLAIWSFLEKYKRKWNRICGDWMTSSGEAIRRTPRVATINHRWTAPLGQKLNDQRILKQCCCRFREMGSKTTLKAWYVKRLSYKSSVVSVCSSSSAHHHLIIIIIIISLSSSSSYYHHHHLIIIIIIFPLSLSLAAHFLKGIVFSKLVWKFPQRAFPELSPARWDRIGVFWKRELKVFLCTKKRLIYPT